MPRIVFSIFVWLFFLDGTFSVADDALQLAGDVAFLNPLRNALAGITFLFGFVILAAFVISPRYPKRLLLGPVLFLIWTNACQAFPFNLEPSPFLGLALSLVQLLGGGALLYFYMDWHTFIPFHFALDRPAFSWKNSLLSGAIVLLAGLLLLPFFLLGQLVSGISSYTAGYLQLHHDGIYLTERHFQKKDREIRLISMMHVGNKDFYSDLTSGMPSNSRGVVLLEGLTNNKNITPPSLGYEKMAGSLGLTAQNDSDFADTARTALEEQESGAKKTSNLDFRKADIDLSDLQPRTLQFVDLVGAAYRSSNMKELMQAFHNLNTSFPEEEAVQNVMHDILDTRNNHLFREIEGSLKDYPVVLVPWGALHLPDIESRVRTLGFEQTYSKERKVLSFW